jgi:hypothetical protein
MVALRGAEDDQMGEMRRKFGVFTIVLAACALLSACDKCGGLQELRYPGGPKVCADDKAR